jgi:CubicO group peptidase (beta-lactamase class C family)
MAQGDLTTVRGTCAPRFELVRQEFERNFAERGESGAAVAIIVDGEAVVDLWGGAADVESGRPWDQDTMVVVWSCTKGATALCAHILADRGELDLDAPVGRYWPEFACEARMSFGYTMNKHGGGAGLNERGQSLIDAAYRSLHYHTNAYGSWA